MKQKKVILVCVGLLLLLAPISMSFKSKSEIQIIGAWKILEVKTVKSDGTYSSVFPKESEVIFMGSYYSLCWTSHDVKLRSWQVADSVKLSRFNQSIINTGTFTLKDSILTTKTAFAMSPMFSDGGIAKFKCFFSGDTLVLKGLSVVSSENISHPAYANGLHFVSRLVKADTR
jgi:hypothetical protein